MRKRPILRGSVLGCIMALTVLCAGVSAGEPFASYEYTTDNYNGLIGSSQEQENAKLSPAALVPDTALNAVSLHLKAGFNNPQDIACDKAGNVFVADAGNKRLVVIDESLTKVLCVIGGWTDASGARSDFADASGIFISSDNLVYVCFAARKIIVAFPEPALEAATATAAGCRMFRAPDVRSVMSSFDFKPVNLVVDQTNRMYVVVQGLYNGLLMMDDDGSFAGFFGANRIQISAADLLWRKLSTTAQVNAQNDYVPVEFSSLDINADGFIYTTAKGRDNENMVRRLNLIGNDVLKTNGSYIRGELSPLYSKGDPGTQSDFIDISVAGSGIYSCLDSARGRVFTYDADGDLMFVTGGVSAQVGGFKNPAAIQWHGDDLLVLDQGDDELDVFRPTEYGGEILRAVRAQQNGDDASASALWARIILQDPHNRLAQLNVGKTLLNEGKYRQAMEHFQLGSSTDLYSKAYEKYRRQKAASVIPWVLALLGTAVAAWLVACLVAYFRKIQQSVRLFLEQARKYGVRRTKEREGRTRQPK